MEYKKLWTDMHSNIHHEQMELLPEWFGQVKKIMDFWPVAYYPFYMRPTESGLKVEDRYEDGLIKIDWEQIREFTNQATKRAIPCSWAMSGREREKTEITTCSF